MNSKKQILLIGITFISIFSILFFSIKADYSKEYEITKKEITGINEITDIYKLDIVLKSIRGLNQLKEEDSNALMSSLFIKEDEIQNNIIKLKK